MCDTKCVTQQPVCLQGVPASVIGGLASRESNGGDSLKDGYGDNKKAWGILQVRAANIFN